MCRKKNYNTCYVWHVLIFLFNSVTQVHLATLSYFSGNFPFFPICSGMVAVPGIFVLANTTHSQQVTGAEVDTWSKPDPQSRPPELGSGVQESHRSPSCTAGLRGLPAADRSCVFIPVWRGSRGSWSASMEMKAGARVKQRPREEERVGTEGLARWTSGVQ